MENSQNGPATPGPTPQYNYIPVQTPPKKTNYLIPIALAVGCLPWAILLIVVMVSMVAAFSGGETSDYREHIALIRVDGVITASESGAGIFSGSESGSEDIIAKLEEARKNKSAKAIIIRINSPGGSPAGSEEVFNEIMAIRKSGKPVYTSMGDLAASGGYYIASASNKIYADATSLTGSIGVIFHTTDMSSLYKKIGFNPQVVKSGKFKDIGSPNRALTPEERTLMQTMVNETYNQFVNDVSKGRGIPVAKIKPIADGRVFTGSQAKKLHLVDEIGGLRDTIKAAAKATGMSDTPRVKEYGKKGLIDAIFGGDSRGASSAIGQEALKEILKEALISKESSQSLR